MKSIFGRMKSIIIGDIPKDSVIGDGSVVIAPPAGKKSIEITLGTAIGKGAKACPHSIAIGDGAISICENCLKNGVTLK